MVIPEATIPDFASAPRRFDRAGALRSPYRRVSDGAVLVDAVVTREGILEYPQKDGTIRRELVTRAAVLDTARTLPRSATTLEHPKEGFVSPDTVKEVGTGDVDGEALVQEDTQGAFCSVKLALRRQDAIEAFDTGTHTEVSCGYSVILDETPGEHPIFGRYDARQVGRDCNHLAQVERGRAGPTVSLRADSADAAGRYATPPTPPREKHMKPQIVALLTALGITRLDNEDVALQEATDKVVTMRADADDKVKAEAEAEKAKEDEAGMAEKLKAAEDARDACQAKYDKLKGEFDAMKADMDKAKEAEKARKDAADLERLQALAKKVSVKHDGLDLPALRVAIAKTRVDSVTDESSAGYIDGILDTIEKGAAPRDPRYDGLRHDPNDNPDSTRTDGRDKPSDDPWLASQRQEA